VQVDYNEVKDILLIWHFCAYITWNSLFLKKP